MSVLIYAENWDGKFKKSTAELVSYGAAIASETGVPAHVVSIGKVGQEELRSLGKYGASRVIDVDAGGVNRLDNQVYTDILARVAEKEDARLVLMSNNNTGKALAPRLSVRMKAALVSGVNSLPEEGIREVSRKVFSGKAFARVRVKTGKAVYTLSPNAFEIIEKPGEADIEKFTPDMGPGLQNTVVEKVEKQTDRVILTDAEIVVSGGRGMKSPDNWAPIEELAHILGGACACTRPVSDEGWRPPEEHTGQTGKIIAPNLYIAIGISGAIQHLAGVSSSKYIVAINTDKDAPIFEAADYGIHGDAMKVLPKLIEEIKTVQSS